MREAFPVEKIAQGKALEACEEAWGAVGGAVCGIVRIYSVF